MHIQWLVGDKVMQESTVAGLEPHGKTQADDDIEAGGRGDFRGQLSN